LVAVSYNLHGFNQGSLEIKELIATVQPEIIMVQENWLTTDTAFIISKTCISVTNCLVTQDQYTAIKLANWLFITVYFPSVGTINRDLLYCDLLAEVDSLIAAHPSCDVLLAGDFNEDLQINSSASSAVKNFISRNKLYQCDILFPSACRSTYFHVMHDSTHASSTIDYMLTSNADSVIAFNILDIDIHFSDHLQIYRWLCVKLTLNLNL